MKRQNPNAMGHNATAKVGEEEKKQRDPRAFEPCFTGSKHLGFFSGVIFPFLASESGSLPEYTNQS
jgi:hypothetical protein